MIIPTVEPTVEHRHQDRVLRFTCTTLNTTKYDVEECESFLQQLIGQMQSKPGESLRAVEQKRRKTFNSNKLALIAVA